MEKHMTITEELKAIQAGELPCSDNKRAACVAYCWRRIKMMENLMNSDGPKTAIAQHMTGMQEKIDLYSSFIDWAEAQPGDAK